MFVDGLEAVADEFGRASRDGRSRDGRQLEQMLGFVAARVACVDIDVTCF